MKQKLLYLVCVLMGLGMQLSAQISKGSGTAADPYRIETADDLAELRNYVGAVGAGIYFRQENDIDLAQWIDNHAVQDIKENGWIPIGEDANSNQTSFRGSFNGQGFRITGLWIDRPGMNDVGLFGALHADGTLENVKVVLDAKGVKGNNYVGGLAGGSQGEVTSCSVEGSGTVAAGGGDAWVGGLTSDNWGSITTSYATVSVTAGGDEARVGGLTGYNGSLGSITTSYATVSVAAEGDNANVGGLTGWNSGSITSCYATGAVTATAAGTYNQIASVGGLTGFNYSSITSSYATGSVEAEGDRAFVGGLTGYNLNSITSSYATGPVTAYGDYARVGGLIGGNSPINPTTTCYATSSVTATGQNAIVGGLIGVIDEDFVNYITSCYYLQEGNINQDLRGVGGYCDIHDYTYNPYEDASYPPTLTDNVTSLSPAGMQTKSSFNPAYWQFITNSKYADPDKGTIWMLPAGAPSPYLWWECEPLDDTAIYHTVTLVVDSGIRLYNFSPGPLVVEDGDHLYLQFLPESPGLTAADLVLTINGTDTPFRDFGNNRYCSYILNPVDKDYEIRIALRDNTVGNAAIHAGKASVVVESGQLKVESPHPVDVAVYIITGQSVVFVRALSGTKIFDLPSGIYIVRAGTTTTKVVIND